MHEPADNELLRRYSREGSESAFAALVTRYVNLVYSAALRKTGSTYVAEEVTQAVFIILARKAGGLREETILSSWLYQTTRLTAANFVRTEFRRARREQEAYMQSSSNETESAVWQQIEPFLEDAMGQLGELDRGVIVLRFFEGKSFQEISSATGVSENAAKKRMGRALDKLRGNFSKRGIVCSSSVIATALTTHSVHAAPATLAGSITAIAAAKGTAASGTTLTLIKGALKLMAWSKAKTAIVLGAGLLLAAGTATVTVRKIAAGHENNSWQIENIKSDQVAKAPPLVRILPTKFPGSMNSTLTADGPGEGARFVGIRVTAADITQVAFKWFKPARILFNPPISNARYDFISTLPQNSAEALQGELKKQLGLVGHREMKEMDVQVLRLKNPHAPGIKAPISGNAFFMNSNNGFNRIKWNRQPLSKIGVFLENELEVPVVDQTGGTGDCSIDLTWQEHGADLVHHALKQALLDQLGLELAPGRETIEVLMLEKGADKP
jgi:uncharacterized protein (TIGR03435 family)